MHRCTDQRWRISQPGIPRNMTYTLKAVGYLPKWRKMESNCMGKAQTPKPKRGRCPICQGRSCSIRHRGTDPLKLSLRDGIAPFVVQLQLNTEPALGLYLNKKKQTIERSLLYSSSFPLIKSPQRVRQLETDPDVGSMCVPLMRTTRAEGLEGDTTSAVLETRP
ncbi:hypothetical protein BGZ63DRAFT_389590 [Mariannaea sp. PMI_226]|nr:hypothetical protein BGZ63DRAFT_389590 [Mariannaea sp. PMI_226]